MGHWTLSTAEDTLDRMEGEKATLDGECAELADDLQRAVELLRRCTYSLQPNRLDSIARDAREFVAYYDAAYQPEPEKMCATRYDYILAEYR